MTAEEVYKLADKRFQTFKVESIFPALKEVINDKNVFMTDQYIIRGSSIDDVLNINGCRYYQWLTCLIDVLKPKQIVELGGAMGTSALMMLQYLPEDSRLYSITLPEGGKEFKFIKDNYQNLVKVIGNDLDLSSWPKELDLSKTDLWFFDTEHTEDQLRSEFELYSPFFKKDTIILIDDIFLKKGITRVWNEIDCDKYDATDPLHYTGFGILVADKKINIKTNRYYAQCLEDQYINTQFELNTDGVFVDVGAGDGVNMSNSLFFENLGWKCVCIDADPRVADSLKRNRKIAYSALISSKSGELELFMNANTPDLSGIIKRSENKDKSVKMKSVTLESILEKENIGKIDILSIDTEGSERDVWESLDYKKHQPEILIIEFSTQGVADLGLEAYFKQFNYKLLAYTDVNLILKKI